MTDPESGLPKLRIGFVSTRFSGTDGVSLETEKWATVLEGLGHSCFYFAGESNRATESSWIIPEAFFGHPVIAAINGAAFDSEWGTEDLLEFTNPDISHPQRKAMHHRIRPPGLTRRIHEVADYLKSQLYAFVRDFGIELLIVENALAIPMNIPLGIALTEFIAETGFPTIGHHHDLYSERARFQVNCVSDYLNMAFPPHLPSIRHIVINSVSALAINQRLGISATVIPNVMDFEHPPAPPDEYPQDLRDALGLARDELLFLQPTRVIDRKGIEHAIELTRRTGLNARLVISHASGDEGNGYEKRLREFADLLDNPVTFVSDIIGDRRGHTPDGRKIYSLWDVYPQADLVTYPSILEGFGNAFLEAVYFRQPIVVNDYTIFKLDIKPKGFRAIEFDGYITKATIEQTLEVLSDPELRNEMAEHNYRVAERHYSYSVLERHLQTLIADCFGEEIYADSV